MPEDASKIRGRIKLKDGAVPTNFNSSAVDTPQNLAAHNEIANCNNCGILIIEKNELKNMLLKLEINIDIERQSNREYIEKINLEKSKLNEQLRFLKKQLHASESQIKKMKDIHCKSIENEVNELFFRFF